MTRRATAMNPALASHETLAAALLQAVREQHFEDTPDALRGGAPLDAFPSLDLAVIAFPPGAAPVWANVLFSREHPQGFAADIPPDGGPLRGIRFEADLRDAALSSVAWQPGADWSRLAFAPLWGAGPRRMVAPYPASLVKLMVALGIVRAVDAGRLAWGGVLDALCEAMLTVSDNAATDALVARLHACGAIAPGHHDLHAAFAESALPTLRLDGTRPDGGWRNADGAGVGRLQMTAWDTARLLWRLDADAPAAPWLAHDAPPLCSDAGRARLRGWLEDQALHEVLSSTALAGVPGWVPGLPARLPARWIAADGSVQAGGDVHFPADVRPASAVATRRFAHKTGTTETYASDAGIVRGQADAPGAACHCLVALVSTLGRRTAPHPACATTWRLPALGAAIDAIVGAG